LIKAEFTYCLEYCVPRRMLCWHSHDGSQDRSGHDGPRCSTGRLARKLPGSNGNAVCSTTD
jgi:hypothetical protein